MTAYDFWLILLTRRIVLVLHSATTATWTSWGSHGGVSMGIVAMLQLVPEILCSVQVRWCQPPGDAWWLHEHKWGALSSINMKLGAYWHHWVMMMGWMMSCRYDWHMTVSLKNTTSVFFVHWCYSPVCHTNSSSSMVWGHVDSYIALTPMFPNALPAISLMQGDPALNDEHPWRPLLAGPACCLAHCRHAPWCLAFKGVTHSFCLAYNP